MNRIQEDAFPDSSIHVAMARQALRTLTAAVIFITVESTYGAAGSEQGDNALSERNRLVTLVRDNGTEALPEIDTAITNENEIIRRTAVHLLADLGKPAHDVLVRHLMHDDPWIRYTVAGALEDLGVAGEHVEQLATDDDARIRRRFHRDILPEHLLVNGKPPDDLIARLEAAYDQGSAQMRYEMIETVAELPLTASSIALLRRASDLQKAVVAAEGDKAEVGPAEQKSLIAYRVLLERDMGRLRELADAGKWRELADVLEARDIQSWPDTSASGRMIPEGGYANEPAEAWYLLAKAYYELGQGRKAERTLRSLIEDLDLGIAHHRQRRFYVMLLDLYNRNYQEHLSENDEVRDRYVRLQFEYGNRMVAAGRKGEALESYQKVLKVEGLGAGVKEDVDAAIDDLATSRP